MYIYTHIVMLVVRGWLKTRYDPLGNGPAIGSAVDLGIRAQAAQLIAPTMDDRHNIIILLLFYISSFNCIFGCITSLRESILMIANLPEKLVKSLPVESRLSMHRLYIAIFEQHPLKIT